MVGFITTLQKRSLESRKRIAFFTTVIFTGCVIFVWITTFDTSHDTSVAAQVDSQAIAPLQEISSSFDNFLDVTKKMSAGLFGYGTSTATTTVSSASK